MTSHLLGKPSHAWSGAEDRGLPRLGFLSSSHTQGLSMFF